MKQEVKEVMDSSNSRRAKKKVNSSRSKEVYVDIGHD
jgi:hypothetical protein